MESALADLERLNDELLTLGKRHRVLGRPLFEDEQGVIPRLAESADGYELISADGRRFIDWTGCGGSVLLGYRHPAIENAIEKQFAAGPMLPMTHPVEVEVASMLVEMVPCAEMVAFGKNGSDALTAAVRAARAATGRDVILHYGFHGFHDWYVARYAGVKGVPKVLEPFIRTFPYHDLTELERLFESYSGRVAAVVMEPFDNLLPEPGYLEGVKELAHGNGALLVFDELVTGFRVARGGAQELLGVVPDLACFGKGLANGMPLSAVMGKRQYMEELLGCAFGMTFRGETLSLAAARAVLDILRREPVCEHLAATGAKLRVGFREACVRHGVHAALVGPDARLGIQFDPDGGLAPARLLSCFVRECARNGILTNGMLLPSYSHDDHAVERTLEALDRSLEPVAAAVLPARAAVEDAVRGAFATDSAASPGLYPGGVIEYANVNGDTVEAGGWILEDDGPPDSVALVDPSGESHLAETFRRPDLEVAFPQAPNASGAGFRASAPASAFARDGAHEFTILATKAGREVFRCPVVYAARSRSSSLPAVRWTGEKLAFEER